MNFKELKKQNKELQDKLNLANSVVDKQLKAIEILKAITENDTYSRGGVTC